nr:hypothetical protein [Tanacetum cinerariifolium]
VLTQLEDGMIFHKPTYKECILSESYKRCKKARVHHLVYQTTRRSFIPSSSLRFVSIHDWKPQLDHSSEDGKQWLADVLPILDHYSGKLIIAEIGSTITNDCPRNIESGEERF